MADGSGEGTVSKQSRTRGLKPFVKGDPRINRLGRPKSFDTLRKLAQSLINVPAVDAGGDPVVVNGEQATETVVILRELAKKNPERYLEIAFGKVPNPIEVSGPDKGPIPVKAYKYAAAVAAITTGSEPDSEPSGEGEGRGDGSTVGEDDDGG